MLVALAVGRHTGVFTSRQLEVPGVSDHRKGLVIAFLHACGLLMRGGGRGVYRATPAARRIAEAWGRSEALGRRELAGLLDGTWFAGVVRKELGESAGQRATLVNRLLAFARAPETRRGEAEVLIMWLLEARLLLPVRDGYVRWNAAACAPVSAEAASADELKEDTTGAGDGEQRFNNALAIKRPGAAGQAGAEPFEKELDSHVTGTGQMTVVESVVDSIPSLAPCVTDGRPDVVAPFEDRPSTSAHGHFDTTASGTGTTEDEMLDNERTPDAPTLDGRPALQGDAIPPQTARSADAQSVRATSQLTKLAHLGEIAGEPIMLHELLQLSEEELLSMYRGLRRFVEATAGAR
ncbi:hypothetical protein [Streptomyces sp. NPDC047097]|uniref:hypothetical protein n=1 Tax=Streptomyces sp. NPDC047097 TaxID=3155260 RepID=UPI0033C20A9A